MNLDPVPGATPHSQEELPVWLVGTDLMAAVSALFVLLMLVAWLAHGSLLDALAQVEQERDAAQAQQQEMEARLKAALSDPLLQERLSFEGGRIGIAGSLLFALNSSDLEAEGRTLLAQLAAPLSLFLDREQQLLMVGGFTDNLAIHGQNRRYDDNWELSAQRALTVTRTLIAEGVPADRLFAAAFGEQQAIADNDDAEGRARNRRVELTPLPLRKPAGPADAE